FAGIITVVSNRIAHKINLPLAFLFASGALLTTSIVHVIPEAMERLDPEFPDDLHGLTLRSGIIVMAGIFAGFLLHAALDHGHPSHSHAAAAALPQQLALDNGHPLHSHGDGHPPHYHAAEAALPQQGGSGNTRALFDISGLDPVCWNVIVGDLAHNFSDGVTMGAAFLSCSSTVGWTVTAANMMHEIPHEVGNFMALVNGGMTIQQVRIQFNV
ncbi:unnamed protein product, partial [Laminaria digitata]